MSPSWIRGRKQGQFDWRDDVLGVGTAGMLLRTADLVDAGGFDPVLGPFGDGLELSRRLRAAGHRVVVVPSAVIRHARESFADTPASFGRRRGSQMYTAIQRAPLLLAPVLFLWFLLLSPIRALFRLGVKDTVRARGELRGGASLLAKTGALWRARKRLKQATVTTSYRTSKPGTATFLTVAQIFVRPSARLDACGTFPPQHLRKEAAERRRRTPSQWSCPRRYHHRCGNRRVPAKSPAFGLTGGGLLPDDSSAGDLLRLAISSWVPTGDGYPGYLDPIWVLAIPFVYVAGWFGGTLTEVVFLFFLLAPFLAGMAAFRASGAVANSPAVRFVAGAAWAVAPPLLSSLSAGQAGAVLLHIVLPLVVAAIARYVRAQRSSHLGSAAWWTLVAGAAYPAFLLSIGVVALVLAVAQRRAAWMWLVAPGVSLAGPALWYLLKDLPGSLVRLPGATFSWQDGTEYEVVAGWPGGIGSFKVVILVATGLVVLAAMVSLARARRFGTVRAGWALVGLGGLLVSFSLTQEIGVDERVFETAMAWPGPGLSLLWLGLLVTIVGGAHGIRADLSDSSLSLRHALVGICALGLVALPVASAASWLVGIHTGSPQHAVSSAPEVSVPALAQKSSTDPEKGRTLVVTPEGEKITVSLWRGDGPQLTHTGHLPSSRDDLGQALTRLGEDDFADLIAEHAVTVILIPGTGEQSEQLARMLDATDSITRVTTAEVGTFWRVDVPSGRVMQGGEVLPSGVIEAAVDAEPGVLYLAERDNPKWTATQNGEELERADDDWRAAWTVEEAGEVTISHEGGFSIIWVTLLRALLIIGNVTVSLPWRIR